MTRCTEFQTCSLSLILFVSGLLYQYTDASQIDSPPNPLCGIGGYDTRNLTRAAYWILTSNSFCLDKLNMSQTCTFELSFCKPLPDVNPPCKGAAVCQQDIGGSTQAQKYRIGAYNSSIDPFIERFDAVGFSAQYNHGQNIFDNRTIPNQNRTVGVGIFFECDKTQIWTPIPGQASTVSPLAVTKVTYDDTHTGILTYWIYVRYAGACIKVVPLTTPLPVIPDLPEYLSAGTVLIIIFICATTLYCVVGCVAKSCTGSKGADVIPNNEMWSNLSAYTQEGFRFLFCNILCCKQTTGSEGFQSQKGYDSI